MKRAVIIGAGFSGMCSAYYLSRAGFQVEVFEKSGGPGGLIKTIQTPHGLSEIAANGILNSATFEEMAQQIKLELVSTLKSSKRRYIYRGRPRRWPLGFFETLIFFWKFASCKNKSPKEYETVYEWGHRVLGQPATEFILSPALHGIYAGDLKRLSAHLILSRFFKKKLKRSKPKLRGLVAPPLGMGEFFIKMENYLRAKNVTFNYETEFNFLNRDLCTVFVVATSARACGKILEPLSEKLAHILSNVEMLSLIKANFFYHAHPRKYSGFGILFPQNQGIRSLGVLFNDLIFQSVSVSESYILGGANDSKAMSLSDQALSQSVSRDRDIVLNDKSNPVGHYIQRWPETLPHYTVTLEKDLRIVEGERRSLEKQKIFIMGNFLGGIGLSQILDQASMLASRVLEVENGR
jgi:oxygen-dependent protoporphyrinogen oxidase